MPFKFSHYTHSAMLCRSLEMHQSRLGQLLRRAHGKWDLVPSRKQATYKLVAILGKMVLKPRDCPCRRIILITTGWPNMPWFWDLVSLLSHIHCACPACPIFLLNHLITVGGYRSAITAPINVSKDKNLTRLIDNFHR